MPLKNVFKTTRRQRDEMRASADALSIGWFFFAAIGLGYAAGWWIDQRFHTEPWGGVVGAMLGVGSGFLNLVQVANRINKAEEELARRRKEERDAPP